MSAGNAKVGIFDNETGTDVSITTSGGKTGLDVNVINSVPIGGGFGAQDDLTITDTTVGSIETIVITNGTLTKTVTIDDSTGGITIIWS